MIYWYVVEPASDAPDYGVIAYQGRSLSEDAPPGSHVFDADQGVSSVTHYLTAGAFAQITGPRKVKIDGAWIDPPVETAPVPTLEGAKASRLQALADRRWTASATFTFNGVEGVSSDDTAQTRITATIAFMSLSVAPASVGWEVQPGDFLSMTLADLQSFGGAMGAHVQACWSNAQAITAEIMAASTVDDVEAVDLETGWPA